MRFKTLILVFSFCFLNLISAENKQVVTEMQISDNDSVFKYNYLYNNDTLIVVESKAFKTATGWQNISQKEWFPQQSFPHQVERKWIDNGWQDVYSVDFSSEAGTITQTNSKINNTEQTKLIEIETTTLNNLKQRISSYLFTNSVRVKNSETQFFYSNQQLDSSIYSSYENEKEISAFKTCYSYNADMSYKQVEVLTRSANSNWINSTKTAWYYVDNTGKIRSQRSYNWNSKSHKWETNTKLEYAYNAIGKVSEEISYLWKTMRWAPVYRYSYNYNINASIEGKQVYFPIYRDWRNTNSVNFIATTNSRNLTIESVYGFWGGKTGDKLSSHISVPFNDETIVRSGHTIALTYAPFVGTNAPAINKNESRFRVYPNPSHGLFYISNTNPTTTKWTLTALNGAVLKKSHQQSITSIMDISDLPNGIYMLTVSTPNENQTSKIVKY